MPWKLSRSRNTSKPYITLTELAPAPRVPIAMCRKSGCTRWCARFRRAMSWGHPGHGFGRSRLPSVHRLALCRGLRTRRPAPARTNRSRHPRSAETGAPQHQSGNMFAYNGPECGACAHVCPVPGALSWEGGLRPVIDQSICTGCALCREACITNPKSVDIRALDRANSPADRNRTSTACAPRV